MASRRLDISSLLCDDNPMPFSPLEALVHAATEEKRRLDQGPDYERQQQQQRFFEDQQRHLFLEREHRRVHHPPSIAHLISPDPPISTIPIDSPDPRHIKKRRYSLSPSPDDKERIIRERDKMFVGELGYGRVDPVPSFTPRRPGSGHGHPRKPVAVADLLSPPLTSTSHARDSHRLLSPLGRRSPPGSQIGRAKAARKSDEYQHPPSRPPISSLPPPPPLSDLKKPQKEYHTPKLQQEDPHEWFLQQFDQVPSPTTRTKPPRSPTPLPPPTALPPPFTTAHHKPPVTAAVALEQELEGFPSKPTVIVKQQEPEVQMDLDVDLAVTELVQTMERDVKPPRMEVDVEDELLSLVDDHPAPSSSTGTSRRPVPSSSSQVPTAPATASTSANTNPAPPRSVSEASHASPSPTIPMGVSPASAVHHPSVRPTPERGSMPPPTATGAGKKGAERAGSVVPPATTSTPAKKKKEAKVGLFIYFENCIFLILTTV